MVVIRNNLYEASLQHVMWTAHAFLNLTFKNDFLYRGEFYGSSRLFKSF